MAVFSVKNIINVIYDEKKILMAIKFALSSKFQKKSKINEKPLWKR